MACTVLFSWKEINRHADSAKRLSLCVSDGDLYTGTVADFSGTDPIIYRESLQTEQYDSMSLNGECCSYINNKYKCL
jgi:hypothetical protein